MVEDEVPRVSAKYLGGEHDVHLGEDASTINVKFWYGSREVSIIGFMTPFAGRRARFKKMYRHTRRMIRLTMEPEMMPTKATSKLDLEVCCRGTASEGFSAGLQLEG